MDSANYNTATVTVGKSVSILAVPGAVGSVIATAGPAISISAGGLVVALHNIVIVPLTGSGGTDGVSMTGASTLTIEECLIANLPLFGVHVVGTGTARITNSILRDNGGHGVKGEDGALVTVSGSKLLGNGNGSVGVSTNAATTTTAVVSDSILSGGLFGVSASANSAGASVRAFVTRCTIETTTYAFYSATFGGVGSTLVSVSGSMITNNVYAWFISGTGAAVKSLGNNHLIDNSTNLGSLTTVSLQ